MGVANSLRAFDSVAVAARVRTFIAHHVIPREAELYQGNTEVLFQLETLSRHQGIWGGYRPADFGGPGVSLCQYLPLAEEEGYSEFGPAVLGSDVALDIHFLSRHGNPSIKSLALPLLLNGAVGAFAVTEPDSPGSMPGRIRTTARRHGDQWFLSGGKWFISRAESAAFFLVLACVEGQDGSVKEKGVFYVPSNLPGVQQIRRQTLLGRDYGQSELVFDQVSLPPEFLLMPVANTAQALEDRLVLGRTVRSMQWVGLGRRCLDLLCQRLTGKRAVEAGLHDKQLLRAGLFEAFQMVTAARLLVTDAAEKIDHQAPSTLAVNNAKVAATRALSRAVDVAVQIWGAEGLLDQGVLSGIYRYARATRMMDGADEALMNSVGRQLLQQYRERGYV